MSREQPSRPNFTGISHGDRNIRDPGNRHYFHGSRGEEGGTNAGAGFPAEANIKEGLDTSTPINTISRTTPPSAPEDFPIENVKYIASYNWIDAEKPTIVVPGTTQSPLTTVSDIETLQVLRQYGQVVLYRSSYSQITPPFFLTRTAHG